MENDCMDLPPGFRFHPTDEEIITHYLSQKVMNNSFTARALGEVDLNKCEPWDLPKQAKMGEKEWYFFCHRDRKYPTGMRTNRATEAGYWKATGKDKEIYKGKSSLVGMKKTLVFYRGRAPKGEKTNWVMHEFRLEGKFSYNHLKISKDDWVVCRVVHKNTGMKRSPPSSLLRMNSFGEEGFDSPSSLTPFVDFPSLDDQKSFQMPNNYFNIGHMENPCSIPSNSSFYPQFPHSNPLFFFQESSNMGNLHQERTNNSNICFPNATFKDSINENLSAQEISGFKKVCKVEQFSSNHSVVSLSQDTGLSTDLNTEISSVISKHDMGRNKSYEDLDGPSSSCPLVDLECLWNY